MAEVAVCVYSAKNFGLPLVRVARFSSLLVLVFVVAKMLCSGTTFVLAIGSHRSPTELQRHHDQQKHQHKAAHDAIVAIVSLVLKSFAQIGTCPTIGA